MNGIINLIKPAGMTSHDAVAVVRRLAGQRRIGHAGTLDPGACGVLPLFLGNATRLIQYATGVKTYRAEMTLGIATQTQDAAGETTAVAEDVMISPRQLGEVFAGFLGELWQTPPMVSALKVGGRRLYELARKGEEVERQPRLVRIFDLHIRKIWPEDADVLTLGSRILFDVQCSAGTYIRTLCVDIGAQLGCPAHMSFLIRTASGPFQLADAVTLEELTQARENGRLSQCVMPPEVAVPHLPPIRVDEEVRERILHGAMFPVPVTSLEGQHNLVRVHDAEGQMIAVARPVADLPGYWQPERVFLPSE